MLVIVGLPKAPSMADDRVVPADRTPPREEFQWDHPGSMLSFVAGSAIKRIITAGVKARRDRSLLKFRSAGRAFTLRQSQFQTRKEYCFPFEARELRTQNIGRYKRTLREELFTLTYIFGA
jgi:hypothetical protein